MAVNEDTAHQKGQPPMTSTPGSTPGNSDSGEPDDGNSPAAPSSAPSPAPSPASAPRAGSEGAAASEPADAPDAARPAEPGGQVTESPAGVQVPQQGTRWAQEQPPPAPEGWARWTQPPGPSVPRQGGQQHGGPYGGVPRQGPSQPGWSQYGRGPAGSGGWGQHGWQPAQGGRPPQWGQQPAWGWGQGGPQAPKPGVIPLRPLDVGEILDGALATFRRHWKVVAGAALAVGAVTQALDVVVRHQFMDQKALRDLQHESHPTLHEVGRALERSLAGSGLMLLIALTGTIITSALLTIVVSRAVLGRPVTAAEAWQEARGRIPRVLGLTLLIPLIGCLLVLVAALPGLLVVAASDTSAGPALTILGVISALAVLVWLYIQWSLSAPALILENQAIVPAMKRSWKLVRGSWWRVLGVQLLAMVLTGVIGALLECPFILIANGITGSGSLSLFSVDAGAGWTYLIIVAVGGTLSGAITLPVTSGVSVLLYLDQRIRRESLDIELAQAAAKE